jgi:hypothetical protein
VTYWYIISENMSSTLNHGKNDKNGMMQRENKVSDDIRVQKRKKVLDSTLLGFQPTDIVEYEVSSEPYKVDLYASYGRFKTNNIVLTAPSHYNNPNWTSTNAGENLRQELDAYNEQNQNGEDGKAHPSSSSSKTNVNRSKTNKAENKAAIYGDVTPDRSPTTKLSSKPPKSQQRKPPKAPRSGTKGENLIWKFNDPTHGSVNTQIGIDNNNPSGHQVNGPVTHESRSQDVIVKQAQISK